MEYKQHVFYPTTDTLVRLPVSKRNLKRPHATRRRSFLLHSKSFRELSSFSSFFLSLNKSNIISAKMKTIPLLDAVCPLLATMKAFEKKKKSTSSYSNVAELETQIKSCVERTNESV